MERVIKPAVIAERDIWRDGAESVSSTVHAVHEANDACYKLHGVNGWSVLGGGDRALGTMAGDMRVK
jgi:hypothetical protein